VNPEGGWRRTKVFLQAEFSDGLSTTNLRIAMAAEMR
jgi:hypothetical protein